MAPFRLILLYLILCSSSLLLGSAIAVSQIQQSAEPEPMKEDPRFSLDLKDVPVREAIAAVLEHRHGMPYVIEPNVGGRVTINLKDVTFDSALRALANVAGLIVRQEGGTLILGADPQRLITNSVQFVTQNSHPLPPPSPGVQLATPPAPNVPGVVNIHPWDRGPVKVFDVTLENANLFEAIKQTLELAGKDYVLDLGIVAQIPPGFGPRVTAKMRQVSLDDALTILSRTAGLEFEKRANTYIVRYKGLDPPRPGKPGTITPSYPQTRMPERAAPHLLCPKCGFGILEGWRFCPNCGNPVGQSPPHP